MKLLPLLLLSATALATAVPAALDVALDARVSYEELKIITTREETKRMDVNDLPSPDTPIAFEITVDFDSYPDIAMPPEITKGFWDFDVVFTEYWIGPMLHSHGTFKTRYGDYDLDYEGEDNYTWIKLNDKYLQIIWNWVEHRAWFKFGDSMWALDIYSHSKDLMAMCYVTKNWDRPVLADRSTERRTISSSCWIKLHDGEVIWDPEKRDGVAARNLTSASSTATTMTVLDLNLQAFADLPPPTPGFWSYELTITESYDLEELVVTGDFKSDGGHAKLNFVDSNHSFETPVLGKTFRMSYDYSKHLANFAHGDDHWGMDMYSAALHGFCNTVDRWNKAPLEPNSDDFRQITLSCWIHPSDTLSTGHASHRIVSARAPIADSDATTATATGTPTDRTVSYAFDIGVTELCEDSEGTPPRAIATWVPHMSSEAGVDIDFEDGTTAKTFPIANAYITVGTYDYAKHQVAFHYAGCNWNLNTKGVADCGYCHSAKWSAPKLDCTSDATVYRTYTTMCHVRVRPNVA